MKHWPPRQMLMLLLGALIALIALIALGTGISSVQAGGMAVDMAFASDEGMSCDGCPGDAGALGSRLPAPPIAVDASGWSSPPDPSPPKDEYAG